MAWAAAAPGSGAHELDQGLGCQSWLVVQLGHQYLCGCHGQHMVGGGRRVDENGASGSGGPSPPSLDKERGRRGVLAAENLVLTFLEEDTLKK